VRAAFLGTPAAAVPSLAALTTVADVAVVVTRPDKARGRSGRPQPPPVKAAAAEWGLPVAQPEGTGALDEVLRTTRPDIAVVVAYGRILPPSTLALVPRGFVNVHFSLLPRWRGAAPVERAILAGDPVVGVSLMLIDEGLDTGPVIGAMETPARGGGDRRRPHRAAGRPRGGAAGRRPPRLRRRRRRACTATRCRRVHRPAAHP
jgi:methionyl-tRNA formyltransferase